MKKFGILMAILTVAALLLTACGGGGGGGGEVKKITIKASDEFTFDPATIEAKKGDKLEITLDNTGGTQVHDITISDLGFTLTAEAGKTAVGTVEVTKTGDIEFHCAQPGHADSGMTGTLKVAG